MNPAKKFFLIFGAVSLALWLIANIVLGPPGLSSAYLADYKADHDHYLEISKSLPYKLYAERPQLNAPEPGSDLEAAIAFVEAYENRDAFKAEQRRLALYNLFFEIFNFLLVVIIIWRFARKPLLNLLDEKISELREKLQAAIKARKAAEARKSAIEARMADLPEEEARVKAETEARLKNELDQLEISNAHSLEVMRQELEDRKREEWKAAEQRVRAELVNQAVDRLAERFRQQAHEAGQRGLINRFTKDLPSQKGGAA